MNSHSRITQHGFRSGGGDLHKSSGLPLYRVIDMPEMTRLLLMNDLGIGNGGLALRTPVDDPGALVNIAFFIKTDEYLKHCIGAALVHGKTLSVPVCGGAQLL